MDFDAVAGAEGDRHRAVRLGHQGLQVRIGIEPRDRREVELVGADEEVGDQIVAVSIEEHERVGAVAAGERVVAVAAEKICGRQRAVCLVQRNRVVATQTKDADKGCVGYGRCAAEDLDGSAVDR